MKDWRQGTKGPSMKFPAGAPSGHSIPRIFWKLTPSATSKPLCVRKGHCWGLSAHTITRRQGPILELDGEQWLHQHGSVILFRSQSPQEKLCGNWQLAGLLLRGGRYALLVTQMILCALLPARWWSCTVFPQGSSRRRGQFQPHCWLVRNRSLAQKLCDLMKVSNWLSDDRCSNEKFYYLTILLNSKKFPVQQPTSLSYCFR